MQPVPAAQLPVTVAKRKRSLQYFLSAIKPSAVLSSITCNFTQPSATNLICNKCTELEIFTLTENRLDLALTLPIYGRVHSLSVLRPTHGQMDLLWLMTGDFKCAIVCYDMQERVVKTLWNDNLGRFYEAYAEHTQTCKVDPTCTNIGISLSDIFRVLKLSYELLLFDPLRGFSGSLAVHLFSLPMEVRNVIDYDFMHVNNNEVTVAVLYSDANYARHVRTFDLHLKEEGQILESSVRFVCSDPFASMVLAAPDRSLLTFSERSITYYRGKTKQVLSLDGASVPVACGHISPNEFIVGDRSGRLYLLQLESGRKGTVSRILKTELGTTSQASAITKLAQLDAPEGVAHLVFVSSCFGDSQLITVIPTNSASSKIEVVRSFSNMGPIVDFALVPRKDSENTEIVACSGVGCDGAVSIIRNGITFMENASFEQAGVMGMWPLREDLSDPHDVFLVFGFVNETRIMRVAEESREVHIPGFDSDSASLYVGNLAQSLLLQVTPRSARFVACASGALKEEWRSPEQKELTLAAAASDLILVASGSHLFLLGLTSAGAPHVIAQKEFPNDISALALSTGADKPTHAVISLWKEHLVLLLAIPSLEILAEWPLGGEVLCRSLCLQRFEGRDFLFAGLGDGTLCYTTGDLTTNRLGQRAVLSLGSQQLILRPFEFAKRNFIFVCSDRPCVILLKETKIHVAQVNLQHVPRACPLRSPMFKDTAMVICTNNSLVKICSIGDIQKLHVRKIPLGETPRRIAFCPRAEVCAVLLDATQGPSIRLVDSTSGDVRPAADLGATRVPCAITCCSFEGDEREFVVASMADDNSEGLPERGVLIVYAVEHDKLTEVSRTATAGLGYALAAFQGMLLASCNSQLLLYAWRTNTLMQVDAIDTHILLLSVQTLGDYILVGDLIQSVSLIVYHQLEAKFELRSTEPSCSLALAADFVSPLAQSCMVADSKQMLHLVRIADVDEVDGMEPIEPLLAPPERMKVESSFCVGEVIHRLRRGQLVRLEGRHSAGEVVFGTMNGSIGVIANLTERRFTFLEQLQNLLLPYVLSVGNFSHRLYRHPAGSPGEHTFIDGDLISRFLDLRAAIRDRIALEMGTTAEELAAEIELFHQRLV